jgi:predicted CXXCH cytochrome family protein
VKRALPLAACLATSIAACGAPAPSTPAPVVAGAPAPASGPSAPEPGTAAAAALAHGAFAGSAACRPCHAAIYERWKKTPMANVVRDPREHPEAILADPSANPIHPFAKADVALVYGSIWKQRYFTKVGADYFPEPVQWDVTHKAWKPYFVEANTDWWAPSYPPDNMQRPTGPLCDGCHSVGYDVKTKTVVEWNVGCERCHGPAAAHAKAPSRANVQNPARMDPVHASDTCIQCHTQGRPLENPIEGRQYDWPVGYQVGLELADFWRLEDHKLGEQTFTHFADGTAHKNRMQGNDFVQSEMYKHGVTCASCHDVHGTDHPAQTREAGDALCLRCHAPGGANGPRAATLEAHTMHAKGSAGSCCVACHMPAIEKTIGDVNVRAHTFAFVGPAMTETYKIPNPCTSCHKDRTTAWAREALRRSRGRSPWRY